MQGVLYPIQTLKWVHHQSKTSSYPCNDRTAAKLDVTILGIHLNSLITICPSARIILKSYTYFALLVWVKQQVTFSYHWSDSPATELVITLLGLHWNSLIHVCIGLFKSLFLFLHFLLGKRQKRARNLTGGGHQCPLWLCLYDLLKDYRGDKFPQIKLQVDRQWLEL